MAAPEVTPRFEFNEKVAESFLANRESSGGLHEFLGFRTVDVGPGTMHGRFPVRDELLNGEIFYTLKEAQVLIESWRCHYTAARPHSSLGYRPPAPETIVMPSWPTGSAALRRPPSLAAKPAMH